MWGSRRQGKKTLKSTRKGGSNTQKRVRWKSIVTLQTHTQSFNHRRRRRRRRRRLPRPAVGLVIILKYLAPSRSPRTDTHTLWCRIRGWAAVYQAWWNVLHRRSEDAPSRSAVREQHRNGGQFSFQPGASAGGGGGGWCNDSGFFRFGRTSIEVLMGRARLFSLCSVGWMDVAPTHTHTPDYHFHFANRKISSPSILAEPNSWTQSPSVHRVDLARFYDHMTVICDVDSVRHPSKPLIMRAGVCYTRIVRARWRQ